MFDIVTIVGAGVGAGETILFLTLLVWVIFWKGWSLWISARKTQKSWFIALLIINTIGILDILYIFWLSKIDIKEKFNNRFKKAQSSDQDETIPSEQA